MLGITLNKHIHILQRFWDFLKLWKEWKLFALALQVLPMSYLLISGWIWAKIIDKVQYCFTAKIRIRIYVFTKLANCQTDSNLKYLHTAITIEFRINNILVAIDFIFSARLLSWKTLTTSERAYDLLKKLFFKLRLLTKRKFQP